MNHYVFDSARSYGAFLRAGALGALPQVELSSRWSMLIGLSAEPGTVPPEGPRFHWGNSEQLLSFGRFNQSLDELKQAAKTPPEAWAAEQLDLARDAFRRGLPQEALAHLQRGMEGDSGHDGYPSEYRTHFLQGLIRLGSFHHGDPAVLDLAKAEQAFTTAAHHATDKQRIEAGWAMLAAGWAAYAQGQMVRALAHTEQAITFQPDLGEAYFQAAKIMLHTRQPDLAQPFLAMAVEIDPAFAVQAAVDRDFVRFAEEVFAVVETRRLQVGQVASKAMQDVVRRARECGLLNADGASARPEDSSAEELTVVPALIASATAAMRTNSLYGYLAAQNLAARAVVALEDAILNGQKTRQNAEDDLQMAEQLSGQLQTVQIGTYRLGSSALEEFNRATAFIAQGRAALAVDTIPARLEAGELAKRALVALKSAVASYKASALEQAEADRVALLEAIAHPSAPRDSTGTIKGCAVIGAMIAVIPGGYFNLFRHGMSSVADWPAAMLRLFFLVIVAGGIGALFGALVSRGQSADTPASAPTLDARKTALDQTIARLRDFSLENLRGALTSTTGPLSPT